MDFDKIWPLIQSSGAVAALVLYFWLISVQKELTEERERKAALETKYDALVQTRIQDADKLATLVANANRAMDANAEMARAIFRPDNATKASPA